MNAATFDTYAAVKVLWEASANEGMAEAPAPRPVPVMTCSPRRRTLPRLKPRLGTTFATFAIKAAWSWRTNGAEYNYHPIQ